jgi:predicted nucleotidyltransferase
MFLFGSYARGDAKADSDLDFHIDKGRIRGLFALGGLYADLEDAFGTATFLPPIASMKHSGMKLRLKRF